MNKYILLNKSESNFKIQITEYFHLEQNNYNVNYKILFQNEKILFKTLFSLNIKSLNKNIRSLNKNLR